MTYSDSNCPPHNVLTDVYQAAAATSTNINITAGSRILEITAINDGVFFLKGSGTVSTSNFDGYVGAGTTRHYNIPGNMTSVQVLSTSGSVVVITY